MSEDEEDYMSDKFLAGLQDVRPSLVQDHGKKRAIKVQAKQQEHHKRQRETAAATSNLKNERLQQDLNKPLAADNKGFQLLAKMGYKAGTGLGKQADARLEPIGITIKNDRGGLGREAAIAELAAKRQELRRAHLLHRAGIDSNEEISTEAYRKRAMLKAEERKLQYDIRRCQQTCESLDVAADVQEPDLDFFWQPKPKEKEESGSEAEQDLPEEDEELPKEEQYSASEQLELLTGYLRTAYSFCYWCGTRYDSGEDLETNCPGLTRDDH
ncbi:G patch domain-containing protein 11 isoform X1 [Drosophila miranda]|uniref:G patch domain-containing protein 11 n=1 Tax=Drosophila miranda TaxID=7229 RepID=D0QWK4_DROMI|nr:G patch domain-containing protein 11 isoform X1 [Drosophila miranda]ACN94703.1 GA10036 [Drosophila miranda]